MAHNIDTSRGSKRSPSKSPSNKLGVDHARDKARAMATSPPFVPSLDLANALESVQQQRQQHQQQHTQQHGSAQEQSQASLTTSAGALDNSPGSTSSTPSPQRPKHIQAVSHTREASPPIRIGRSPLATPSPSSKTERSARAETKTADSATQRVPSTPVQARRVLTRRKGRRSLPTSPRIHLCARSPNAPDRLLPSPRLACFAVPAPNSMEEGQLGTKYMRSAFPVSEEQNQEPCPCHLPEKTPRAPRSPIRLSEHAYEAPRMLVCMPYTPRTITIRYTDDGELLLGNEDDEEASKTSTSDPTKHRVLENSPSPSPSTKKRGTKRLASELKRTGRRKRSNSYVEPRKSVSESRQTSPRWNLNNYRISVVGEDTAALTTAYMFAAGGASVTLCVETKNTVHCINEGYFDNIVDATTDPTLMNLMENVHNVSMDEIYASVSTSVVVRYCDVIVVSPPEGVELFSTLTKMLQDVGEGMPQGSLIVIEANDMGEDSLATFVRPTLEQQLDGMKCGSDFFLAATPKFINKYGSVINNMRAKSFRMIALDATSLAIATQLYRHVGANVVPPTQFTQPTVKRAARSASPRSQMPAFRKTNNWLSSMMAIDALRHKPLLSPPEQADQHTFTTNSLDKSSPRPDSARSVSSSRSKPNVSRTSSSTSSSSSSSHSHQRPNHSIWLPDGYALSVETTPSSV